MFLVGIVTAAYITQGGLPASLVTDRIQAWTILFLVIALLLTLFGGDINGLISMLRHTILRIHGALAPCHTWTLSSPDWLWLWQSQQPRMFSQGNWQRAWASESDNALTKGAWLAAGLVLPLVFVMGVLGTVVAGQGAVDDPSSAFFYLIDDTGLFL